MCSTAVLLCVIIYHLNQYMTSIEHGSFTPSCPFSSSLPHTLTTPSCLFAAPSPSHPSRPAWQEALRPTTPRPSTACALCDRSSASCRTEGWLSSPGGCKVRGKKMGGVLPHVPSCFRRMMLWLRSQTHCTPPHLTRRPAGLARRTTPSSRRHAGQTGQEESSCFPSQNRCGECCVNERTLAFLKAYVVGAVRDCEICAVRDATCVLLSNDLRSDIPLPLAPRPCSSRSSLLPLLLSSQHARSPT